MRLRETRRARRVGAAAGRARPAALVAVLGFLLAVAPTASSPAARAAPTDAVTSTVRLASQTAWVQPGTPFVLRLQIAGVPRPDEVDVAVVVHQRVSSRSQFALTLERRTLGSVIESTSGPLSGLLPTDAGGAITVQLDPQTVGIARTGVYPVEIVLREHRTGVTLDRLVTHLLYVVGPIDGPRLGLSWIVAFHGEPMIQPDGGHRLGDTAGLATLADVLGTPAYASLPLVLAPTPETLDGLAAGSGEVGHSIVAALRSALRGRQVVARPYVPTPVVPLVADGLGNEVSAQRTRGIDTDTSVLGQRPDTRTWIADQPLDDDGLARLRELGVDRVVVPERFLAPVRLQVTLAQPFKLGGRPGRPVDAAASDSGLADHFVNEGDEVLAAHQFLADLTVLWLDAPQRQRGVVVAAPRQWAPSRAFLDAALSGLAQSPIISVLSLDSLFTTVSDATVGRNESLVRRLEPGTRPALGLPPTELRRDRERVDALGSTLAAGSPVYDELDRHLLVSESADLSVRRRRAYLDGVQQAITDTIRQVVVPRARTLTLTARQGEIPLTFLNKSDTTMRVRIRLKSDKLSFPDGAERLVDLPPRNRTERFAVRARTTGAFPLQVTVETPEGGLVLATTRFTVRSTAAAGIGVALSIGALVFLLVWWARQVARTRRSQRPAPEPAPAPVAPA